jgi:hypothetical protein
MVPPVPKLAQSSAPSILRYPRILYRRSNHSLVVIKHQQIWNLLQAISSCFEIIRNRRVEGS